MTQPVTKKVWGHPEQQFNQFLTGREESTVTENKIERKPKNHQQPATSNTSFLRI